MELAVSSSQLSPVYEAKYLSSFTHGDVTNVTNNTAIDWTIVSGLKVRGDFSVSSDFNRTDIYLSPMSYSYIRDNDNDVNDPSVLYARGKYTLNNGTDMTLAGKLMLSYTKQLDRHLVQAVVGGDLREVKRESDGYVVTGFMDDALDYVSYAVQYDPTPVLRATSPSFVRRAPISTPTIRTTTAIWSISPDASTVLRSTAASSRPRPIGRRVCAGTFTTSGS